MNWRIEYDEKSNKIVTDEATEDDCRAYYFINGNDNTSGTGIIDKTREKCIEKLLKELRSDIRRVRKELKEKQRLYDELEISLN